MNEIETTKTFQEKMFEKIREQIGTLMTEDDLKKVVDAAMQKAFFENIKYADRWGAIKEEPPVFVANFRELMRQQVHSAMEKWIQEHPEEISKIINEVIRDGIVNIVVGHIEDRTKSSMQNLASDLLSNGILKA